MYDRNKLKMLQNVVIERYLLCFANEKEWTRMKNKFAENSRNQT